MPESKTDKIMNIATKRGFFFPSGEIYASKAGFWTYGHLGTLLKHKFEEIWRNYFLGLNENYYEIEIQIFWLKKFSKVLVTWNIFQTL